jgi:hypothetical protein
MASGLQKRQMNFSLLNEAKVDGSGFAKSSG